MRDAQMFSDGQDLGSLNSTGVVCAHPFDLELDALAGNTIIQDDQVVGWFIFHILSTTNTGGDEGLDIELRASDNANMSTTPEYLGTIKLLQAEITAEKYCIQVHKSLSVKFLGSWYKAINTSLNGATVVDCYMSNAPETPNDAIQKIPT